jgi:hypothetical protein
MLIYFFPHRSSATMGKNKGIPAYKHPLGDKFSKGIEDFYSKSVCLLSFLLD